ncbi:MAG: hypothetical protein JXA42_22285 [Anaerolineales bacterium]|nr:hypothetical protein [Anaerolineales bacterium]
MNAFPLGGIITLFVLLPNLLAVFFPPTTRLTGDPQPNDTRLQIMTVIERIGQVGSFVIPFFYQLTIVSVMDAVALVIMIGTLALYYAGWIRYIVLGRSEELFYRSLLGFPLPMAVMPVIYFLSASVLLSSVWLMLAALMLGVGHISVTWLNSQSIE